MNQGYTEVRDGYHPKADIKNSADVHASQKIFMQGPGLDGKPRDTCLPMNLLSKANPAVLQVAKGPG
jgi:hypothetical protein